MKTQGIVVSKDSAKIVDTNVIEPANDEVLIETRACGICQGDVYIYQGTLPREKVQGLEGAGVVAAVGEEVQHVAVGDKVTALGEPAFTQFFTTLKQHVV